MGLALAAGSAGCATGGSRAEAKPAVRLTVTPSDGTGKVRPDSAIRVTAEDGSVQDVTVTTRGNPVEGDFTADRTGWQSRWRLDPATRYQVVATALGRDGRTQTVTTEFATARVRQRLTASIEAPFRGETVGVGMPIIVRFDRPVADKAEVERALEVTTYPTRPTHPDLPPGKPVEGAWRWFGDQAVVYRTRSHWPRFTKVRFTGHLSGVRAAKGVYGTKNLDLDFRIGEKHVTKASAKTHRMAVYKNGKKIRDFPVSMGRGGVLKYVTTNGNHLTMEKANPVIMDSATVGCPPGCPGHYRQVVYSAVRISNSGEFTHSAPWSVGSQGSANVSHGCVNMSPAAARWFYNFSYRGDPYKITGTSRELEPENGWGYWQLSWKDWLAGSALQG